MAYLLKRGQHQFAFLAVGQHLAGLGIDDLGIEVVLEDVQAVVAAGIRWPRPGR